jgi:hypothetical protein
MLVFAGSVDIAFLHFHPFRYVIPMEQVQATPTFPWTVTCHIVIWLGWLVFKLPKTSSF